MQYLNRQIKDLLNDNLTLLSYNLDDTDDLQLQLVNNEMRLVIYINTKDKKTGLTFLTGEDLDDEEWAVDELEINY